MTITKLKTGYKILLTDAEAREIYALMRLRLAMGNRGFQMNERLSLLIAREVERKKTSKKRR